MKRVLETNDINDEFVPTPAASVYAIEVDGEAVLLDEDANRLHRLNATATIVWASFDGRSSVREIASDLADALGVSTERTLPDVLAVTRSLAEEGLLELDECAAGTENAERASQADPPAPLTTGDPRFVPQPPSP